MEESASMYEKSMGTHEGKQKYVRSRCQLGQVQKVEAGIEDMEKIH